MNPAQAKLAGSIIFCKEPIGIVINIRMQTNILGRNKYFIFQFIIDEKDCVKPYTLLLKSRIYIGYIVQNVHMSHVNF